MKKFEDVPTSMAPPPLALALTTGPQAGSEVQLHQEGEFILGRAKDADVVIIDDKVSRHHARVVAVDGAWVIEDLDSSNGTSINGRKVKKAALKAGDRIRIGPFAMKVVAGQNPQLEVSEAAQAWWERTQVNFDPYQTAQRPASKAGNLISGSIREISMMDVLQLLGAARKTGVLITRSGGQVGKIHLREGSVFHASVNGHTASQPEKTVYRLLRIKDGTFELGAPEDCKVVTEITEGVQSLLMEAGRQADEIAELEKEMPPPGARLALVLPLPGRLRDLPPDEMDVLQLVIERSTVLDVLDNYPNSDLEACTHLVSLLRNKYLVAS